MSAIVLYEILHCLTAACLAVRLFCHAHSPAQTKRYVLAGAAACLFLGDVYWLAHLIIRGEPPAIFSACDVAYIGFLLMFNTALPGVGPQRLRQRPFAVWMAVFTLMNVVAWMIWTGAWFNNLLWGVPMLLLAAHSAMLVEKDLPQARRTVFSHWWLYWFSARQLCLQAVHTVCLLPCASCYGCCRLFSWLSRSRTV